MFTLARMWNVSAQRHQQHYIVLFRATGVWEKKWYKIDSKMKAHRLFVLLNLSYVQASSDQEPLADPIFWVSPRSGR